MRWVRRRHVQEKSGVTFLEHGKRRRPCHLILLVLLGADQLMETIRYVTRPYSVLFILLSSLKYKRIF